MCEKTLKQRILEETEPLEQKVDKLNAFLEDGNLLIDKTQESLLVIQLSQMNAYLNTLKLRLALLEKEFDWGTYGDFDGEQYGIVANVNLYSKEDVYELCIKYHEDTIGELTDEQHDEIYSLDIKKVYLHDYSIVEAFEEGYNDNISSPKERIAWKSDKQDEEHTIACWDINFENLDFTGI